MADNVKVTVTLTPNSNDPNQIDHQIDFPTVTLRPGDSMIWLMSGLPADHFVFLDFVSDVNTSGQLFQEVSPNPAMSNGSDLEIHGTSLDPPAETPMDYPYHIEIWDSSRRLLKRFDPMIDNLGPPPQG